MRNSRLIRRLTLAACLGAGAGCTHHHYYGGTPVCDAPMSGRVVTAPVVAGTYCDVPAGSSAPVTVATRPGRANTVITNRRPPSLVTSQPAARTAGGWRDSRSSGGATTRISGALDDDSSTR